MQMREALCCLYEPYFSDGRHNIGGELKLFDSLFPIWLCKFTCNKETSKMYALLYVLTITFTEH